MTLDIYTAQYRYNNPDRLDVTVKGQNPIGKMYAPTWEMVKGLKNGMFTEQQYAEKYMGILNAALNSYSSYIQSQEVVVLVCFCPPGAFCHRIIMAEELERMGIGVYHGEKPQGVDMRKCQIGDITQIARGVIVQQVNAQGVMGAGLALQLRNRFPAMYAQYRKLCQLKTKDGLSIGKIFLYQVNHELIVANLCAQTYYGREKRHTEYWAFRQCLQKLREWVKINLELTGRESTIFFPHGIGSSLAGGDRSLIHYMISHELPQAVIVKK